jgi:uncharacterized membrane protein YdjX (TVP38/TMEM64 family)
MSRDRKILDTVAVGGPLVLLILAAALWSLGPVDVDRDQVRSWVSRAQQPPQAAFLVVVGFVAGGLVVFPVSLLILATVFVFGPLRGGFLALVGAVVSGVTLFGLGRLAGRRAVVRLLGGRADEIGQRLAQKGVLTVAVIRNLPVAPYSVVNFVAGTLPLRLRDFVLGTGLGLLPAVLGLGLLEEAVARFLVDPSPTGLAVVVGMVVALGAGAILLARWLLRR